MQMRVRPMAASAAIMQLRDSVEHPAVLNKMEKLDSAATQTASYAEMRGGPGAGIGITDTLAPTAEDLKNIRAKAWVSGGYQERYDETARAAWRQHYDTQLQALDQTVISPLAEAHLKRCGWLP